MPHSGKQARLLLVSAVLLASRQEVKDRMFYPDPSQIPDHAHQSKGVDWISVSLSRRERISRTLKGLLVLLVLMLVCALGVGVVMVHFLSSLHGLGNPPARGVLITSIAMVSATEGWAVGEKYDQAVASMPDQGFMLHYQHGVWGRVALPSPVKTLTSIFMLSASEGWAVGDSTILHYQAGSWSPVALPPPPPTRTSYYLSSVFMLSASDGWAVGDLAILRYQAGRWSPVALPPPLGVGFQYELTSVFMVSATEGWAVGGPALLHYHNGVWSQALDGAPSAIALSSIAMVSPTEGWAVGNDGGILHYMDGWWQIASSSPGKGSLTAVVMHSASEGWAVGEDIAHYRAGAWQTLTTQPHGILTALALVGDGEGWAGGGTSARADEQGRSVRDALLLHYTQGQWVEVPVPVHA